MLSGDCNAGTYKPIHTTKIGERNSRDYPLSGAERIPYVFNDHPKIRVRNSLTGSL